MYPFHSFMMMMVGVSLQKTTVKNPPALVFSFTQLLGLYVIQPFAIVVPIPSGEGDTAYGIVQALGGEVPEVKGK